MNNIINLDRNHSILTPILTAIAILAMAVIGIAVYGASTINLIVFALFIILYVQLPGMFVLSKLKIIPQHISTAIALGLFSGWSLEILTYFVSDLIHTNLLLWILGPLMTLAYLYERLRVTKEGLLLCRINPRRVSVFFCVFILLILTYSLLNTQYLYLSPILSDFTHMNPDKAYHMGLINSLSHDYPLESPWVQGVFINYHFFSEILYSIPVRLFGLDADFILMSCGPYLTAYSFGITTYSFFREMSAKPERAGLYSLLLILSNIYVSKSQFASLAFKFILINDNAAGYGISATFATLILLKFWYKDWSDNARINPGMLALLTLFVMVTTGIKGPMGGVLVAGLWGTYFLGLILKKVPANLVYQLIIISAAFYVVYHFVLGSKGQSNASGASFIDFATITDIAFWKKPLIAAMKAHGIPSVVRLMVILATYLVFFLSAYFLPFIIGYLREFVLVVTKRRDFDYVRIVIYAECLVGFVALMILNYSGHSQIYFGLITVFLAPIIAYWLFEDMESWELKTLISRMTVSVCRILFIVTIAVSTATLGMYYFGHIKSAIRATDRHIVYSQYLSISTDEYEAMKWIEENTEPDALLATNRYFSVEPEAFSCANRWSNRFFLYSVYSNRFCYIEGSGYDIPTSKWYKRYEMLMTNSEMFNVNSDSRADVAKSLGVDYVVVSKRFSKVPDLSNSEYNKCFDNDAITIYQIN